MVEARKPAGAAGEEGNVQAEKIEAMLDAKDYAKALKHCNLRKSH
jgi:hypothetical protein